MFSKIAAVVSTAAGAGMQSAIKDIFNTLFYWEVPYVERYGIAVQAADWDGISAEKKRKSKKTRQGLQKGGMGAALGERKYWLDKKHP